MEAGFRRLLVAASAASRGDVEVGPPRPIFARSACVGSTRFQMRVVRVLHLAVLAVSGSQSTGSRRLRSNHNHTERPWRDRRRAPRRARPPARARGPRYISFTHCHLSIATAGNRRQNAVVPSRNAPIREQTDPRADHDIWVEDPTRIERATGRRMILLTIRTHLTHSQGTLRISGRERRGRTHRGRGDGVFDGEAQK